MSTRPFLGEPAGALPSESRSRSTQEAEGDISIGAGFEPSQANWPQIAVIEPLNSFVFCRFEPTRFAYRALVCGTSFPPPEFRFQKTAGSPSIFASRHPIRRTFINAPSLACYADLSGRDRGSHHASFDSGV
jgi:hypothetical protein